ncbi:mitochondrial carrier [Roridomyces roridus]|uniref:Mitochondrial carrier n=1 Tax=Roridomyces roridus TaxID=1738132 RepID=A0AAD7FDQ4_9AGAR|nr:mitochondrial carrier [Roridomyces roridus]
MSDTPYAVLFPIALLGAVGGTLITLLITMPFAGVLIRYRATYAPKALQGLLTDEGEVQQSPSPSIGYIGMAKRVYRIEGWAGFYKGIMPSMISGLVTIVVISPFLVLMAIQAETPNGEKPVVVPWGPAFAVSIIPGLLIFPFQIVANRAITTPHKLASFAPSAALRVLLSPAERAQPLRLYLTPGVAFATLLEGLLGPFTILIDRLLGTGIFLQHHTLSLVGATVVTTLVATLFLTPLKVVATRLTLQRLGDEDTSVPSTVDESEFIALVEPVVDVRGVQEKRYTGLIDAGRAIVREEGVKVLFRAWWLTTLLLVGPVIGAVLVPAKVEVPPAF